MLKGRLSLSRPLGHVDFYVNSGRDQPHCIANPLLFLCSHFMARQMYTYSIRTCQYNATSCDSFDVFEPDEERQCTNPTIDPFRTSMLGFHARKYGARGIQHVVTKILNKPYC